MFWVYRLHLLTAQCAVQPLYRMKDNKFRHAFNSWQVNTGWAGLDMRAQDCQIMLTTNESILGLR